MSKTPLRSRLLIILGSVLIVISGGTIVAAKVILDKAVSSVDQIKLDISGDSVVPKGQALQGAMNILLVGIDDGVVQNIDDRSQESARADSIMILHIPASHQQAYLTSIPRDTWVKIPKYPKTKYGGGSEKINAAYTIGYGDIKGGGPGRAGGLELLILTIKQATGLTMNAAATVNFTGFTEAVKILGGVTMYVDEHVESVHYGFTTDSRHVPCNPARFNSDAVAMHVQGCRGRMFEVGTHHFTAEEALDYTRQREWMELGDSDYGRQRHQRQFIKALMAEAKSQGLTGNLPKTLSLVTAVGNALSMWTNGEKLEDWFFTLKDLASADMTMIKTNEGKFNPADVSGTMAEELSPDSISMFKALQGGTIDSWLAQHPGWVDVS